MKIIENNYWKLSQLFLLDRLSQPQKHSVTELAFTPTDQSTSVTRPKIFSAAAQLVVSAVTADTLQKLSNIGCKKELSAEVLMGLKRVASPTKSQLITLTALHIASENALIPNTTSLTAPINVTELKATNCPKMKHKFVLKFLKTVRSLEVLKFSKTS